MRIARAFIGGVAGGAVMTIFMALGRASGVPFSLEMVLGTLCGGPPSRLAWGCGFALHLVISGLIGVAYAYAFELLAHRASWRLGVVISIAHSVIGWAGVTLISEVKPLAPDLVRLFTPGESAFLCFAVVHAIYGAVVGAVYGPTPASLAEALFDHSDD
jgi:hypothetical protein